MRRITGLDWPLSALAACLLASSLAGAIWIDHFDDGNVGVMLLIQSVPYALAAGLIVKGRPANVDNGRALVAILVVGVVMRLLLFPGWPVSTDIYRYVWDGRVQGAGINPYLHLPADSALSGLRDDAVYPYINRADYAPTIYPPASQIVFRCGNSRAAVTSTSRPSLCCWWRSWRSSGARRPWPASRSLPACWSSISRS